MQLGAKLLVAATLALWAGGAFAQGIVPPAVSQFTDSNGVPLAGGSLGFFAPGTTTLKATFSDSALLNQNPNPLTLDSAGRAIVWGNGLYRQVLKDANGNTIWDQVTSAGGSSGGGTTSTNFVFVGGTSTGSANAQSVAALNPTGFALSQGNIVIWKSGFTNSAAVTLNPNFTGNTNLFKMGIAGPVGLVGQEIQTNTTYAALYDGNEFVLMQPTNDPTVALPSGVCLDYVGTTAPAGWVFANSGTVSRLGTGANLFAVQGTAFGAGDGTTTFNSADLRGRASFGVDNMGAIGAAGRLGSNSSAGGVSGTFGLASAGGAQAHTPILGEMFNHTHSSSGSISSYFTSPNVGNDTAVSEYISLVLNTTVVLGGAPPAQASLPTNIFPVGVSVGNAGSSSPFNITPPLLGLNKLCKL